MPDPADESARARAFARFAAAQVREVLSGMTAAYAPLFSVSPPEVTVRAMKRRFASCFYTRDRICYSTSLIFLPMECVELTVCHELAHFRHHDHSAAFYAWLGVHLADHRQRRTAMKEIQLPRFAWD
jgi:predicted metal-dependent hydrolase